MTPTITYKMDQLVQINSDTMREASDYSDFVISVFCSAFEEYGTNGNLSEENLLKYIENSIQISKEARKVA